MVYRKVYVSLYMFNSKKKDMSEIYTALHIRANDLKSEIIQAINDFVKMRGLSGITIPLYENAYCEYLVIDATGYCMVSTDFDNLELTEVSIDTLLFALSQIENRS